MRNAAALAQWVLSLISTPESAAATVGDLIESGAEPVRLWSVVVGQVCAPCRLRWPRS